MVRTKAQAIRAMESRKVISKAQPPASKRDTAGSAIARTGQGPQGPGRSAQKHHTSELLQAAHQEALESLTINYKEIQVGEGVQLLSHAIQARTQRLIPLPLIPQTGVKSTNSVIQADQKIAKAKLKDYNTKLETLQSFDKGLGALAKKEGRLLEAIAGMDVKLKRLSSTESLQQEVKHAESRAMRALA